MALVHVITVATATVKFTKVVDREARDGEGAGAVVLEDFVVSAVSTAACDGGRPVAVLLLDSEGVLANGAPPDIVQRAGTLPG